jgi:hypothetical protein
MQVSELEEIIRVARAALTERKRLARLSENYVALTNNGGRTRARTTTYNANSGQAVELAKAYEADLKRMIHGESHP